MSITQQELFDRLVVLESEKLTLSEDAKCLKDDAKYDSELNPAGISKEDIKVPIFCPILDIKLEFHFGQGAGGKPSSPSLDRIDNTKGYIKGNVQVISHLANQMKSTATKEQLVKFADWIKSNG